MVPRSPPAGKEKAEGTGKRSTIPEIPGYPHDIFSTKRKKDLFPVGANFGEREFSRTKSADSDDIGEFLLPGHLIPKILQKNPIKVKFTA